MLGGLNQATGSYPEKQSGIWAPYFFLLPSTQFWRLTSNPMEFSSSSTSPERHLFRPLILIYPQHSHSNNRIIKILNFEIQWELLVITDIVYTLCIPVLEKLSSLL